VEVIEKIIIYINTIGSLERFMPTYLGGGKIMK